MDREQLEKEITYTTARSGGKGGQNVNKVETAVTAWWYPGTSQMLSDVQKELVAEKLQNRMNSEGAVVIKAQTSRSQLANKEDAFEKLWRLVQQALVKRKSRIASRPTKASKEKRLEEKKRNALIKQHRSAKHW